MRLWKRLRNSSEPKAMSAQRRPGMLKLLVAELRVSAGGNFPPERCKGDVLLARKNQVGVDLVGNDDEIAFDGKLAQCKQLVTGEHPSGRILWIAESEDAGSLIY